MFERIVLVCDGNICRSPTAAALLQAALPGRDIQSAGLVPLVGHDMDASARDVAQQQGLSCPPHQAQALSAELAARADLLLVMEKRQRNEVMKRYPAASGKVFLLSHWSGGEDIPDPYRRDRTVFENVYRMLEQGVHAWLERL